MSDPSATTDHGRNSLRVARHDNPTLHVADADLAVLAVELSDALVIADPAGVIVFWNHAAARLFGWSSDEALGQTLDLIIPERLRRRHWDGYRRVMETGYSDYATRLLEVPALQRSGEALSISFTVTLLRQEGRDDVSGIAALIRDDTERWHELQNLKKRLAELEAEP